MRNDKLVAAIALALGTVPAAHAVVPTLAQCQAPQHQVYVAGSSAAQKAFFTATNADVFAGNGSLYVSSNGNFQALCGVSASAAYAPVGDSVLIHYRAEGGSVVGALPIAAGLGHPLNFLLTSGAAAVGTLAAPVTLTVTGSSATVGTTDGWGGGNLVKHEVDIGIVDIEPAKFVGANFPSAYSPAVFGTATPAQLGALNISPLVDQVFGIYVNTSGLNGGASGQALNLSRETIAGILDGTMTDWSQVPTVNGGVAGVASNVPAPIVVENREAGSGTRTGASIYFLNYNCSQSNRPINETGNDGFATGDVLNAANSTAGAITYASIDNSKPNLTLVSIGGMVPSNVAATSGDYDWWFEAQTVKGNTALDATGTAIYNYIKNTIPTNAKAPQVKDILTIPGAGVPANPSVVAPAAVNGIIYTNPFGRNHESCGAPKRK
jgi:hypothetical protein